MYCTAIVSFSFSSIRHKKVFKTSSRYAKLFYYCVYIYAFSSPAKFCVVIEVALKDKKKILEVLFSVHLIVFQVMQVFLTLKVLCKRIDDST